MKFVYLVKKEKNSIKIRNNIYLQKNKGCHCYYFIAISNLFLFNDDFLFSFQNIKNKNCIIWGGGGAKMLISHLLNF